MNDVHPAPPLEVEAYRPELAGVWDPFVSSARNATFLFQRSFMDYHAQRFGDASLILRQAGRVVALFPANVTGGDWVSHGGLTYGGLLLPERTGAALMRPAFDALLAEGAARGLRRIVYKTVPTIYHRLPAEDDRYELFRRNARLLRRDLLTVVPPEGGAAPSALRRRSARRRARLRGLELLWDAQWAPFWALLEQQLALRHGVSPVHTLLEIRLLAERFPHHVRLLVARLDGEVCAGTVLFETTRVSHAQYFAAGETGRRLGLLDAVIEHAMERARASGRWFDFGISTEDGGRHLNAGLVGYKESFGGRSVVHDCYEIPIA